MESRSGPLVKPIQRKTTVSIESNVGRSVDAIIGLDPWCGGTHVNMYLVLLQFSITFDTFIDWIQWKLLRSVDFGSIKIKFYLLNDDAEEVIGTLFKSSHLLQNHNFSKKKQILKHVNDVL